jgi:hypothetical protein
MLAHQPPQCFGGGLDDCTMAHVGRCEWLDTLSDNGLVATG